MLKIPSELRRTIKWLLVSALVAQLVVIPWKGRFCGKSSDCFEATKYGSLFVPPSVQSDRMGWWIDHERLIAQLAVTAALLLLWLAVSKSRPER